VQFIATVMLFFFSITGSKYTSNQGSKVLTDDERIKALESLVLSFQDIAHDNADKLKKLRLAVQKNCGHWYDPGYGLRCWVPDKWVTEALGFKPKGPDSNKEE
jgi:hypothetical protein